jgi:nitrogen fixation protein FixH
MASVPVAAWKHFPRYMIMAMLFVAVVNARFIMIAVATFPGAASNDDFDTSNRYNAVIEQAARQNALGWTERASLQGTLAALDLSGPDNKPLTGAVIVASAARPLGTDPAINLIFHEFPAGHYLADMPLPAKGQYDLGLRISLGGHNVRVTRRVLVP